MNIIKLAKEAGWTESTWEGFLNKFAALVRAEALEEAAKVQEQRSIERHGYDKHKDAAATRGLK